MVEIPFSKLISIIWGVVLAFLVAKALIDIAIGIADYFAFSAADIIARDVGGRIDVTIGIPGNVTIPYKFPKNIEYNLTASKKIICAKSKAMLIPTYECKITIADLLKEYSFFESGIEIAINKTLIGSDTSIEVEKR
jgi:hypothetical protein